MKKLLLALASIAVVSLPCHADGLVGGVNYSRISDEDAGVSVDLSALSGSIGYSFDTSTAFRIVPEARVGFGISDDTVSGVKVKLESFYGIDVRGEFGDTLYGFIVPSYTNYRTKATFGGLSASDNSWEFGIGGGVGYHLNDQVAVEASYENIDSTDVYNIGLRVNF